MDPVKREATMRALGHLKNLAHTMLSRDEDEDEEPRAVSIEVESADTSLPARRPRVPERIRRTDEPDPEAVRKAVEAMERRRAMRMGR